MQLPNDKQVSEWYADNINEDCSASSAIYLFRLWLNDFQKAEQPSPDWVSVNDRLPEIGRTVLIYDGDVNVSSRGTHYAGDKVDFMDDQDEQPGYYSPTHWMPLPEPPKTDNP